MSFPPSMSFKCPHGILWDWAPISGVWRTDRELPSGKPCSCYYISPEYHRPLCNVAWPCGERAFWALKVFATIPRYSCILHERDMRAKNAELRRLDMFPEPWVARQIEVDFSGRVRRKIASIHVVATRVVPDTDLRPFEFDPETAPSLCPQCGFPLFGWTLAEIGWDCASLDKKISLDPSIELGEAGA